MLKLLLIITLAVLLFTPVSSARDYSPSEVNELLETGKIGQLIQPLPLKIEAETELKGLIKIIRWIHQRYQFEKEKESDFWTSSDAMYLRLKGDCEDWAILYVALARFSLSKGVPPKRIFVMLSPISKTETHAWVFYRDPLGNIFSVDFSARGPRVLIEPRWPPPVITFNDQDSWAFWLPPPEKRG